MTTDIEITVQELVETTSNLRTLLFDDLKLPANATIYRGAMYFDNLFKGLFDDCDVWAAGGCFRSYFSMEKIEDVDLFTTSREECARVIRKLRSIGWKPYFSNKNAHKGSVTIEGKTIDVDVVKRFYKHPSLCLIDFDFSVTKFSYHYKRKEVHFTENFFADLTMKRLVFPNENASNPLGTLKRMQKYINKGYFACNGTLLTLAKALGTLDLNDPEQNDIEFYPDGSAKILLFD